MFQVAEYKALIMGMELAIRRLEVRGDSLLIVNQMNNVYEVRKPDLVPYHRRESSLAHAFTYFNIEHVPRGKKARADALVAWLAASMTPSEAHKYHTVFERPSRHTYEALAECNQVRFE